MREVVNRVALRLFEHNEKAYHPDCRMICFLVVFKQGGIASV